MSSIQNLVRKIARYIHNKSTSKLVNKLILLFASIIILVVVSLTYISYKMIETESVNNDISSNKSNLRLVNKNLANYYAEIEQFSLPGLRYADLMSAIANEPDDYMAQLYIEDYLRSLFYARQDVEHVYLYLVHPNKYYYISRENPTIKVSYDEANEIPAEDWFKKTLESSEYDYIQSLLTSDADAAGYAINTERSFMGYHRTLRTLIDREPQAIVSLFFNKTNRDAIIRDIPRTERESLALLNADDVPFYVSNDRIFEMQRSSNFYALADQEGQDGLFEWTGGNDRYLIISDVEETAQWRLMKSIPYDQIYQSAETSRNVSMGIGGIFLLVSLVLVSLTSNAITRPLIHLSRKMNRVSLGNFDVEAKVQGHDEIALLSRQFNEMVVRTNDLINERYKMKLVEKSAILKALEAEINPHFLYNALQAISTKSLKSGEHEIAEMVDALALTLRYCISGQDIVSLSEEMKHIENYLVIQKARFGARLRVIYDWDDDIAALEIPKLSIQTLVENAIKHGLEIVSTTVTIHIQARLEADHALISVIDDGPGILPEQLDEIMNSLDVEWEDWKGESIGLKNLHTRLRLIYGNEAGIEITADETGTVMSILIPRGGKIANV